MADDIIATIRDRLAAMADPAKAAAMAAYMKTDMPFYGVAAPDRRLVAKELNRFPPADHRSYEETVLRLWSQPHREEKYLAIAYARRFRDHVVPASLPLYRRLVVEGAWWDLVDDVAIHLVGAVLATQPGECWPTLDGWIDHPDIWLRRTALLSQIGRKQETEEGRLFDYCLRRAGEREFFIRKAIGWALREYARTRPESVSTFLDEHGAALSPLSVKEASSHLGSLRSLGGSSVR